MSNSIKFVIGTTGEGIPAVYTPAQDGHLLVAGSAGAGKTEVIKTILGTALSQDSEAYVFETLRGGAELDLPRSPAIKLATELDAAADLMTALQVEVRIRRELALAYGFGSVQELPEGIRPASILAVLDESSSLLGSRSSTPHDRIMHDHILEVLSSLLQEALPAGVTIIASVQSVGGLRNGHSLLTSFATRLLLGRSSREARAVILGSPDAPRVDGGPGYGVYLRGSTGSIYPVECQVALPEQPAE